MISPGYSGTPLAKKLGLQPGLRIQLIDHPAEYFEWLATDPSAQIVRSKPDWVHLFAKSIKEFEKAMRVLDKAKQKNSKIVLWVSWYKKSSGISTDLNENIIREYALANGWVDIKVCAVSDQWSGLKLVVPLSKRK